MKKHKPNRRASTHYGPWHVMLASPDKPMQPSRYRHQLTRMHLAMASITKGESPTDEDWRLIADAINLVETLSNSFNSFSFKSILLITLPL